MDFPEEIKNIAEKLSGAGHKTYLVGGCVRDLVISEKTGHKIIPKDWDIATNARPDEIQKVFSRRSSDLVGTPTDSVGADYDSFYENNFGTVVVKTNSEDPALKVVEVTTFRIEGKYTDKRHPDEIKFAKTIEEDLSRRDFTVNALALSLVEGVADKIIDPFNGQDDIKNKIIRTVGDPNERFMEDALRLMRAVRFSVQMDFEIEMNTRLAIEKNAGLLEAIAKERVRDEFAKIIMSERPAAGILLLEELDLLRYVVPELREGLGVGQNKHHIYTVFEHNIRAVDYTAKQNYSLEVRMASLLHDVGKPRVKGGDGPDSTFYGHEVVGAKMTVKILDKLHFSKDFVEKVGHLVRCHLFYYNVGEVTEAGVRRFLRRVGTENVDDLIRVREADRIGSGVPKAVPYKLRHLLFMIEKVKHDPISPKMLKINGTDIMELLKIPPGPKIGQILNVLLEEVLDNPAMNTTEALTLEAKRLSLLEGSELIKLSQDAKETKQEFEAGAEAEIKKKFHV